MVLAPTCLIHEVAMARPELLGEPHIQRIVNHHTTASRGRTCVCEDEAEACSLYASRDARERDH